MTGSEDGKKRRNTMSFVDWHKNPWTLGSYSFPRPNEVMRVGELLRTPFHGRLHFAGEHTCYAFPGYMEGALQSRLRAAEQIAVRDQIIAKRRHKTSTSARHK